MTKQFDQEDVLGVSPATELEEVYRCAFALSEFSIFMALAVDLAALWPEEEQALPELGDVCPKLLLPMTDVGHAPESKNDALIYFTNL